MIRASRIRRLENTVTVGMMLFRVEQDPAYFSTDILATYELPYNGDSALSMPEQQICSYCFVTKYQQMQRSAYALYTNASQEVLSVIQSSTSFRSSVVSMDR